MVRLSKKRLENHPEKDRITITGDRCYCEIGTVFKSDGIISDSRNVKNDGESYLTGSALVIAISKDSVMYKDGVRVGDTILISKDLDLKPFLLLDNQNVDNPYCAIYSYKTVDEFKKYISNPHNGDTIIVDSFKYIGFLRNEDHVPIETYNSKYEPIKNKLIIPDGKIIN